MSQDPEIAEKPPTQLPLRLFYCDTETTGLAGKACEFALLETDWDLNILDKTQTYLNPGIPMEPGATKINGLKDEFLQQFPLEEDWVASIGGPLQNPVLFMAHNVRFDKPHYARLLMPNIAKAVCSLEYARRLLPHKPPRGPLNHKLGTLAEYFGIVFEGEAHEALADCVVGVKVMKKLLELGGSTLREQAALGIVTIHWMPWGGHKGTPLVNLPYSYVQWLRGLPDLDESLRYSLDKVHGIK